MNKYLKYIWIITLTSLLVISFGWSDQVVLRLRDSGDVQGELLAKESDQYLLELNNGVKRYYPKAKVREIMSAAEWHSRRGDSFASVGEQSKAVDAYQTALKLDPDNSHAKKGLQSLRAKDEDTRKTQSNQQYATLMERGNARLREGNYLQASTAFQLALQIQNTSEAREKLAQAVKAEDDRKQALRARVTPKPTPTPTPTPRPTPTPTDEPDPFTATNQGKYSLWSDFFNGRSEDTVSSDTAGRPTGPAGTTIPQKGPFTVGGPARKTGLSLWWYLIPCVLALLAVLVSVLQRKPQTLSKIEPVKEDKPGEVAKLEGPPDRTRYCLLFGRICYAAIVSGRVLDDEVLKVLKQGLDQFNFENREKDWIIHYIKMSMARDVNVTPGQYSQLRGLLTTTERTNLLKLLLDLCRADKALSAAEQGFLQQAGLALWLGRDTYRELENRHLQTPSQGTQIPDQEKKPEPEQDSKPDDNPNPS